MLNKNFGYRMIGLAGVVLGWVVPTSYGDFKAYNDCIRGQDDATAAHVTNWSVYNGYTDAMSGRLLDFASGLETPVTASFSWNSNAGLSVSQTSGSADSELQPRPGTPAYEIFGGVVDYSLRLIYYGSSDWWVEIEFSGLNPAMTYRFVTTAIRGADYPTRLTQFTLAGHQSAVNSSSEGVYLKNGDQTVLLAGGNHLETTGYVVSWDEIRVADRGDGAGSFRVRAEAYGADYRAYPFGGFLLEEIDPHTNTAPQVALPEQQMLAWPHSVLTLVGLVSDDGRGDPDGTLDLAWEQVSGSGAIYFSQPTQSGTELVFPAPGEYRVRLSASDGLLTGQSECVILVQESACPDGDIDGDCVVSLADLTALAGDWLLGMAGSLADLNGDGRVDLTDLRLLASSWMNDWTGTVTVVLQPREAVTAGARWRLDQGPWQSSGIPLALVTEGNHTLEYLVLPGWIRPANQPIWISRQQQISVAAHYEVMVEQSLVISEFMASNSNVADLRPLPSVNLYTVVDGKASYDDWIEIHNVTNEPIPLEGWYLTDNKDILTKWRFPPGYSIPANGYFVVYASKKDETRYGYPFVDNAGNLHVNFSLSSSGEYLGLVKPDGLTVASEYRSYPKLRGLISYGMGADGQEGYLTGVTRKSANTGVYDGKVGDTVFSVKRGFFSEPFTVAISCATPGATIRYTLDQSVPTETNGMTYDPAQPISITTTTCLRATALVPGWLASNVDTQTYLFLADVVKQATNPVNGAQVAPDGYPTNWGSVTGDYQMDPDICNPAGRFGGIYAASLVDDLKALPTVSLVMPKADWFGPTGIYINQNQDGTERIGSMEFFDPSGSEQFQVDCGFRMQGGASGASGGGTTLNRWKSYKLSVRTVFRGAYGGGQLEYPLFGPVPVQRFDTLVLDSRPQNSWVHSTEIQRIRADHARDQISADTQNALGGYAPMGRPVHFYINGLYWGVYWMHERPDDAFAAAWLGGEKEDYDVLKHDHDTVVSGTNDDYDALFTLSATSPDPVTAFAAFQQKVDVANLIDYLLANYYLGNGDWDHKNWYASRSRFDPDHGKWRYHMWDGEHVLDDGTLAAVDVTGKNTSLAPTGLHGRWIGNAEYRTLFGDRVHQHFFHNGALTPENFASLFMNRMNQIDRAVVGESARWGDNRRGYLPYTRADWVAERDRLLNQFIPTRRDTVLTQLRDQKSPAWYPTVPAPEFTINYLSLYGGYAEPDSGLRLVRNNQRVWYTLDGVDPRQPGGELNAGAAVEYISAAIVLNKSTRVKARARSGVNWSALAEAVFAVGPVKESLRITEVMYHATEDDLDFLELKNIAGQALNLNLAGVTRGITHAFGDVIVPAGGYLLLVKDKASFETAYPDLPVGTPVVQWGSGDLSNSGEALRLDDALGAPVMEFEYKDGWYPVTDGAGFSLTLRDPEGTDSSLWGTAAAWRPSSTWGGSPGRDDSGQVPDPGAVVINEVMSHSHQNLPDWIELSNTTDEPISLGGWYLSDSDQDGELMKYRIADGTVIPKGGWAVFYQDQHFGNLADPGCLIPFALSEGGETVYLRSGHEGVLTGYVASQKFGAAATGISFGLYASVTLPDSPQFVPMSMPTAGTANAYPLVGPIVISELSYNPTTSADEYIELLNISDQPVLLADTVTVEVAPGVWQPATVPWRFTVGISYDFPPNTWIPAGGRLVVALNPTAFSAYYGVLPTGVALLGPFLNDSRLSNGGERVRLSRPGDKDYAKTDHYWISADEVNYGDKSPWPVEADGQGMSLHRAHPAASGQNYGDDPVNWIANWPSPGI